MKCKIGFQKKMKCARRGCECLVNIALTLPVKERDYIYSRVVLLIHPQNEMRWCFKLTVYYYPLKRDHSLSLSIHFSKYHYFTQKRNNACGISVKSALKFILVINVSDNFQVHFVIYKLSQCSEIRSSW